MYCNVIQYNHISFFSYSSVEWSKFVVHILEKLKTTLSIGCFQFLCWYKLLPFKSIDLCMHNFTVNLFISYYEKRMYEKLLLSNFLYLIFLPYMILILNFYESILYNLSEYFSLFPFV